MGSNLPFMHTKLHLDHKVITTDVSNSNVNKIQPHKLTRQKNDIKKQLSQQAYI